MSVMSMISMLSMMSMMLSQHEEDLEGGDGGGQQGRVEGGGAEDDAYYIQYRISRNWRILGMLY